MKQELQYAIELRLFDEWRSNNIQLIINKKFRLICQLCCASLFDGKLDSGRIL